ncbi:11822_t:CDS:2 [Dentiscutata erythropus]|uniref:11822_t:CDS:1 n=1 Tax=Dentiscutata erythropus TaxID=1348616 RepID=A0A9N9B4H6_9GLOM|nr:11822_t:CDS:2 [Dentiscutata erythropus]
MYMLGKSNVWEKQVLENSKCWEKLNVRKVNSWQLLDLGSSSKPGLTQTQTSEH